MEERRRRRQTRKSLSLLKITVSFVCANNAPVSERARAEKCPLSEEEGSALEVELILQNRSRIPVPQSG